ncbi:MAG: DNA polymerase III subunit gamma/tau [Lentisphaerae bacterium]|jgi:DNA polymerase-3 subunit gamma/tau|nr:DNA polymerase III subunit gamma/tau [Lentisphaerota bacterium]
MAYEVLARKWRPQTFDEVVGQDHIVRTLKNAIIQNRISQAYLFAGPRGTGKTTLARIFAKALNCKDGPTITPCGVCASCVDIAKGAAFDVTEIDGASNNGVDDIHGKIIDTVNFEPAGGKYRVYYIDEVHMLSTAAFNALLKTLEEPPHYVKFIFATTEPDKVIGTILSRCQRFDLRRISIPVIVEHLRLMAKTEDLNIEDDAMLAIARGADGGMRDAQSALDQMISFTGKDIKESDVLSVFGLVARGSIEEIAGGILTGDVAGILRLVAELDSSGKDLRRLTGELVNHFRNLLVCIQLDGDTSQIDLTDAQKGTLTAQAKLSTASAVLAIVENLIELESRMRLSLTPRTILETALIRCARASELVDLQTILRKLAKLTASDNTEAATVKDTSEKKQVKAARSNPVKTESKPAYKSESKENHSAKESSDTTISEVEKNRKIIEIPVIKDALEIFDGKIIDIKHK